MRGLFLAALAALFGGLVACTNNPVTGERELSLISTAQEIEIGQSNYATYRQQQGGDYILEPELTRYVEEVGARLAAVSDRELPYAFHIINDSSPNAWALPGGKIAINRGLLVELGSEAELAAVLAHEIVHAAARHGAQGLQRGLLLQGAVVLGGVALNDSQYQEIALAGGQLAAGLIDQRYGRDAERESDAYGMRYMARAGYDPAAAIDLQQTFVRLFDEQSPSWLEGLFASHPPSPERVANNRQTNQALGSPGGERGVERYRRMTAGLRQNREAYTAYDEARAAFDKGDTQRALRLVRKAREQEPREALFPLLEGEILAQKGQRKDAEQVYGTAIAKNPGYYRGYLQRGLLRRLSGDLDKARQDLTRSLELLPTANAQQALGVIAQRQGRRDDAIAWLSKAADSDSTVGREANRELARLVLEQDPVRYLKPRLGLDEQGMLLVRLDNTAPLAVRDVRIVVGQASGGVIRGGESLLLQRTLRAGQSLTLRTGTGPLSRQQLRGYAAAVTGARLAE